MMLKITIASYTPYLKDVDDAILKKYLINEGATVEIISWDDKKYDWHSTDAVIIRSTWDYHERLCEYIEWLDYLKRENIKVFNDPEVVKENIYKSNQIKWMKENNIRMMENVILSLNGNDEFLRPETTLKKTIKKYLRKYYGKSLFVLKPVVSARSYNTYLLDPFNINDDNKCHITKNYEEVFQEMLGKFNDRGIILQVFSKDIQNGEYGMVFLNGNFVQAVVKKPGKLYGEKEKEEAKNLPPELLNFAFNVVNLLDQDKILIARIDAILDNGKPTVMEIELAEPNIYIRQTDGVGLNVYDPNWYLNEVEKLGCHNKSLITFANDIIKKVEK